MRPRRSGGGLALGPHGGLVRGWRGGRSEFQAFEEPVVAAPADSVGNGGGQAWFGTRPRKGSGSGEVSAAGFENSVAGVFWRGELVAPLLGPGVHRDECPAEETVEKEGPR